MNAVVNMICQIAGGALLVPVGVFCVECIAGLLPRRKSPTDSSVRPRLAVLVPAHDEEPCLGETLEKLLTQLTEGDTLLVVADNCSDRTAHIAREHGVEVVERRDHARRGKGYALSCGLEALQNRNFDVLVVVDADSHLDPGSLDALARQVQRTARPAQAVYLMQTCDDPTPRDQVSALAFTVKNLVRPLGLHRLGLPVPLTGTGMAFPRSCLSGIRIASGNLVEDMQLGLDLALAGYAPRLCADARVIGQLPASRDAAMGQRRRWEHGHLRTLVQQAPRLAVLGLLKGKPAAWAMALDLLVPPLSLLLMLLVAAAAVATGAAALGAISWMIPAAVCAGIVAAVACVLLAWGRFARQMLPAKRLLSAASYAARKLPMYLAFPFRSEKRWIRTDRDPVRRKVVTSHADEVEPVVH